uniref:PEHE domain-containing protein n=1 Tax=Macrostomum lignano TaxID=282301 RepID=A0A1I8IUN9_9PLAT
MSILSRAAERDARAAMADLDTAKQLDQRRHRRQVEQTRGELKDLILSKYVHQRHSHCTAADQEADQDGKDSLPRAGGSLFPGGCRNSLALRRYMAEEKARLGQRLSPRRRRRQLVSRQRQALVPAHHLAGRTTSGILREFRKFKDGRRETEDEEGGDSINSRMQSMSLVDFGKPPLVRDSVDRAKQTPQRNCKKFSQPDSRRFDFEFTSAQSHIPAVSQLQPETQEAELLISLVMEPPFGRFPPASGSGPSRNRAYTTLDTKKVTKKDEKLYKASSVAPATSPAPKRCQSGVDGAKNRSSESGVPPSPSSCCRPKTAPARLSAARVASGSAATGNSYNEALEVHGWKMEIHGDPLGL